MASLKSIVVAALLAVSALAAPSLTSKDKRQAECKSLKQRKAWYARPEIFGRIRIDTDHTLVGIR